MEPTTWKLQIHATGAGLLTYTLGRSTWAGDKRVGHGLSVVSSCKLSELPAVLDQVADLVLSEIQLGQPML